MPIVGCEPSCVAMLVDDYLDLVPGDELPRWWPNRHCWSTRIWLACGRPVTRGPRGKMLLHGHCHQKALVGVADTRARLAMFRGPPCQRRSIRAAAEWPARSATSITTSA